MRTRNWLKFVFVIALISGVCQGTVPSPAFASSLPADISVRLVSPGTGLAFNPNLPFTVTLDILGGAALTSNTCDSPEMQKVHFGALESDASGVGAMLSWGLEGNSTYQVDSPLWGWSAKIISGGLECSYDFIHPYVTGVTNWHSEWGSWNWASSSQASWFPDAKSGEIGKPAKVDIAWSVGGIVTHKLFQVTSSGDSNVEIIGLTRGQTIDFASSFKVQGILSDKIPFKGFSVSLDNASMNQYLLKCENPSKLSDKAGISTFSENCVIKLPGGFYTENQSSLVVTPTMVADKTIVGNSVAVNVGKQGVPLLQLKSYDDGHILSQASLIGVNPKTPWALPASFHLEGVACANEVSDSVSGQGRECDAGKNGMPISNIELNVCTAPVGDNSFDSPLTVKSCTTVTTESDGTFKFNKAISAVGSDGLLAWSVDGFYQGLLLTNLGNNLIQGHSASGNIFLPGKPAIPLTASQIASQNKALYNFGIKMLNSYSTAQLKFLGFKRFYLPGKSYLTTSSAQDFCAQLPTVIPGLAQQVGMPANSNFVLGCATAASKIKIFK